MIQALVGLRGDITDSWRYEAYYSWGKTVIDAAASGNVNVQSVLELLAAPDGGTDLCDGGFNPFGIQPLSADCVEFINETGFTSTTFTQRIAQAYVSGDLFELPAGAVSVVVGAEQRKFDFVFDPGTLFGPIAGFNTALPAEGTNSFTDVFGEVLIPLLKDQPLANSLELQLAYRHSTSDFNDIANGVNGKPQGASSYGATISWEPMQELRFRGSYQHSVRAPNFGELFSGGSSFPQYFDPCSITTNFRTERRRAAAQAICAATGASAAVFTATSRLRVRRPSSASTAIPTLSRRTGDTFTLGAVFQSGASPVRSIITISPSRTRSSVPDTNMIIAACYGFHGINPSLDPTSPYCAGIVRTAGIIAPSLSCRWRSAAIGTGYFQVVNGGKIKTSGVDFQLGYHLPTDFLIGDSRAGLQPACQLPHRFQGGGAAGGLAIDYADTVSYFGAGLGNQLPRVEGDLEHGMERQAVLLLSPVSLHRRDGQPGVACSSRARQRSPARTGLLLRSRRRGRFQATDPPHGPEQRIGQAPQQYAPNVQSGTDPSLYDVIGRRAYVSGVLRF